MRQEKVGFNHELLDVESKKKKKKQSFTAI